MSQYEGYRAYGRFKLSGVKERLLKQTHSEDMGYKDPKTGLPSLCLRFDGEHDKDGYGQIKDRGQYRKVHHVLKGPLPAGKEANHLCFTRDCARPSHIEFVTHAENLAKRKDRIGKWKEKQPKKTTG